MIERPFRSGRTMNNRERNAVKENRMQQKVDAGLMSELFPEVKSIVINMQYTQKGLRDSLPRTVNFYPGSYAFFRVDCLNKECVEGGFDFTNIFRKMIRDHAKASTGEISCKGGEGASHSSISYEVAIQYV
jgi:hypothetical protein